ncbi:MAG: CoA-binding protein [Spirochaetaceae bacterium]|nr:CoA-binding protein [Spirochaetaceae bacterium]
MDLQQTMEQKSFVVVGDTLNPEKFAYKIKQAMTEAGYKVQCVGKELQSINDAEGDIDIIDLCINAKKGLQLMKECKKPFKSVVLQPGAFDDELVAYLKDNNIPYIEGCLLVGLKLYPRQ